jgi:hypothetical protein
MAGPAEQLKASVLIHEKEGLGQGDGMASSQVVGTKKQNKLQGEKGRIDSPPV